jgi:hypothetical protein
MSKKKRLGHQPWVQTQVEKEILFGRRSRSERAGKRQTKKIKWTRYFNFWSVANEKPRGLIPTLLFDLHQIE